MALSYTFELLFDTSKAIEQGYEVAKRFTDAFNAGKPLEGTEEEFEKFFEVTNQRLNELRQKYEKVKESVVKSGGNINSSTELKNIQSMINALENLQTEAKESGLKVSEWLLKIREKIGQKDIPLQIDTNDALKKAEGLRESVEDPYYADMELNTEQSEKKVSAIGKDIQDATKAKVQIDTDDAKKKLKDIKGSLADAFAGGRDFQGSNAQLKRRINETSAYIRQLKKEYQDVIRVLGAKAEKNASMIQLKKDIQEAESELDGLRENLKSRRMTSENVFAGITQGARGMMGAFTAAQGAAAMFGAEEEKLQKIQTKLQASMSILMGLQQLGNALQSTSQFRMQVINKLMEAYHNWNLKVAKSEGAKKLAMAGWAGLIAGAVIGLTALIIKMSKYADEVKKAKELQKAFRNEFANSATAQLATLAKLEAGWKATNGDIQEQQKFIAKNKGEFESLGYSIKSVRDAENLIIKDKDAVVDSIMAKARATARFAQISSLLTDQMKLQSQIEDATLNGWQKMWAKAYADRKTTWGNSDEWKELGFIPQDWSQVDYTTSPDHDEIYNKIFSYYYTKRFDEKLADKNQKTEKQIEEIRKKIDAKVTEYINDLASVKDFAGDDNYNKELSARLEAARKGYESILRLNQDRENKLAEAQNTLIQSSVQREIVSLQTAHEKRLQEIEREKADYIEKLREQAKLEFLAGNPNANADDFGTKWKPSAEEQQKIDAYYTELARIELVSYERAQANLLKEIVANRIKFTQQYGSEAERVAAIYEEYSNRIYEAQENDDVYGAEALINERDEKIWQARNAARLEYLQQYGTIREKELAIDEKYNHLIENEADEHKKKLYERQREQEKFNLERQKGGRYYNIFRDTDRMNIVQITDAIKLAEDEIKVMSENAAENADKIEALKSALENLKKAANDFSLTGVLRSVFSSDKDDANQTASLAERIQAMRTAWLEMSDDARAKAVGGWASGIASSLGKAAGYMRDVANASGDPRLGKAADELSSVAQNFSAAGQGAASGGWVGAIVAGVLDIFGQVSDGLVNAKIQEIQAAEYAKNWKDAIEDVTLEMREAEYYSPFGERAIAKAREGSRVLVDAMEQYKKKLSELNDYYSSVSYKMGIYGNTSATNHRALDALGIGNGLNSAAVVTQTRKWGGNKYSTLESLYPDLFDNNGEIIIENVKKLLEAESYLNDAANKNLREQLQQLVEIKQAYDDAMRSIDDAISDTFGQLASGITDIIWDSVMNGTDAWSEFGKVGSEVIASLGKQLIQEMVISTYLDNFRERMRAAYSLASPGSTQAEMRNIMGDIFSGLQTVLESGSAIAEEYKAWADEHGFDLTETKERTAISKAISGVSQESFDDALGRFTAIQSHTYEMNETTKTLRIQQDDLLKQTGQILLVLSGIHSDTGDIREAVAGLRSDITLIKSNIGTMADKGVRMLN